VDSSGTADVPAGPIRGERRDVVLVTIDTLRADAVGYSGSGKVETPRIDGLAAAGTAFRGAHAHAVVTLPSHASILTGLLPYQHGVRDNAGFVLDRRVPTLASVLGEAGWATAAFVSAFPLDRRFGLDGGFDVYDDEVGGAAASSIAFPERDGDETVARALHWWRSHADRPRFLWVHLFTPHFPYEPPEPFASRYRDRPYYGEAAEADRELGVLLEPILSGTGRPAIVVVTSDHGESLGEHGEETHGLFAYESTLAVPLVVYAPGLVPAGTSDAPARHIDIAPTVFALCGVEAPSGLPGRPLVGGPDAPEGLPTYFESLSASLNRGWAPLHGTIVDGIKAIRLPIPELYDLGRDPHESDNLADARPDDLRSRLARIPDEALETGTRSAIDRETEERLRSLGYVAGSAGDARAVPFVPDNDPKRRIASERVIDAALSAYRRGDLAGAEARFRGLIAEQPRMTVAYSHLGGLLVDAGRTEDAIAVLESAIRAGADNEDVRVKLALARLRAGRPDLGRQALARDLDSPNPQVHAALGRLAAALGDPAEARARFERALELDPTNPSAVGDLGILLLDGGDLVGARARLEQAVAQDPSLAEAWNALAVVRLRGEDVDGAIDAWRRAVEADPRYPDARFNLAMALGRRGAFAEAAEHMERFVGLSRGPERARGEELLSELRRLAAGRGTASGGGP